MPQMLTNGSYNNSESSFLINYLQVITKRRKLILKITLTTFIFSLLISYILPKKYTASTCIIPPQQDQGMTGLMLGQMGTGMASLASDFLGNGSLTDLYVGILKTNTIKDNIIDYFKLMSVYGEDYRIDTYKKLDDNVDITSGKKDGIITITVEDENPKRAADMANKYVTELENLTNSLNINGAKQSLLFYEQQLNKTKVDLAKAEEALKAFQSKNKSIDVTEQAKASIYRIAELKAKLTETGVQLTIMRRQFTDSSQEVKNLVSVIHNLKSQLSLLESGSSLSAIPSFGSLPSLGQEYIRLMRDYKTQEALVDLLTKQSELMKLSAVKDISSIQVIQTAKIPDKKTKPKKSIIIILSTLVSFCVSIIIVFMLENYDQASTQDKLLLKKIINELFSR